MADAAIIGMVSEWLAETLRNGLCGLCPEFFTEREAVRLVSAPQQESGYSLGVCLYDIAEEKEASQAQLLEARHAKRQRPAKAYSLYYMIFFSELFLRESEEAERHNLLGKILQTVNDCNTVFPGQLQPWQEIAEPPIVLSQTQISFGEKKSVLQAMDMGFRTSLFYRAAPVFLSGDRQETAAQVREVIVGLKPDTEGRGEEDG